MRRFVRWLYRSQYRMSDQLFPVTKELAQWLAGELPDDRITVIANGANTDLFRPIERIGEPFVTFFGGLTSWHGVDLMLDALRYPNWPAGVHLLIIGAGAQQHLVQEAVQSGLPVRWLGYRASSRRSIASWPHGGIRPAATGRSRSGCPRAR